MQSKRERIPTTSVSTGLGMTAVDFDGLRQFLHCAFYKGHKTKKGALLSLTLGSIASTLTALVCNLLIMIPLYLKVMGFTLEQIASLCPPSFGVTSDNFYVYYALGAVLPFNLLRGLIASVITFLLYKSLSGLINRIGD